MNKSSTVFITGAAGGIGRAVVTLFAEKGWRVIGVDRADFGDDFPKDGLFIKSDISRPEDMEFIFKKAQGFTNSLEALVNNAALQIAKPLIETTVEEWDAVMASANIAAYAASKGGLLALTRAMAIEFAPDNIRVNAILPGAVDTPMLRAGLGRGHVGGDDVQERLDNLARKTVNGKVGTPDEIARSIYFLADNEQSSFMTGQALVVDGGATARLSTE